MTITEPTPTRPNLIDSAMSAELLERGEAATDALLSTLPAALVAIAEAEAVMAAMDDVDHGLEDDQFNTELGGSVWGHLSDSLRLFVNLYEQHATNVSPDPDVLAWAIDRAAGGWKAPGPIPDSLSTVHGPEAIADEVRCRRLVIVDDEGTERIVAKTSDAGAVLTVSADGLDGLPVAVALVAGNQGSTTPGGGPYRIAGVQVTVGDGNEDERALLEVSQRDTATNTIPVLTVGRTVFGDAGSCLDTEALVERLNVVERDVERIAGMLTITAAMHGTLKTGEETLRPLYRVDEARLAPLAVRAADHEARARALLAEVDELAAEQEADMNAAYSLWPSTWEGDHSRDAQRAPGFEAVVAARDAITAIADRIEQDR